MKAIVILPILILFLLAPAIANAESFFVNENFDAQGRKIIEANLERTSTNSYFFIEKEYLDTLPETEASQLKSVVAGLASEFDTNIYPKLREVFGKEQSPGIDGDSKVIILLHNMKGGVGGYTRDTDGYASSGEPNSHERQRIYIKLQ